MNRNDLLLLFLCACVVFLLWKLSTRSRQEASMNVIQVLGEATTLHTPTVARINFGIQVTDPDSVKARQTGLEKMDQLRNALTSVIPDGKDMQTADYSLTSHENESKTVVYTFSQSVRITIRDLTQLTKTLDAAGPHSHSIEGLQYDLSEEGRKRAFLETQQLAVLDAQTQAQNMLSPLQKKIGKVLAIEGNSGNSIRPFLFQTAREVSSESNASSHVDIGQISVVSSVSVKFQIV